MRYELIDSVHPDWKGGRFSTLAGAQREHGHAVPRDRFWVKDRLTGENVTYGTEV